MTWQLQDAKNKLSQVVEKTLRQGPQIISRRGQNTVVVISYDDYRRYIAPESTLKSLLAGAGLEQLDLTRDTSPTSRAHPTDI